MTSYIVHSLLFNNLNFYYKLIYNCFLLKPESADSRSMSQIGMSCIGISIGQLLSHTENLAQEITRFQCEY